MDEVAGRLRRLAASHELVLDVPDDLPPAQFDYVEIDQVLTNLIENAVKYTPPGTEIRVSVERPRDDAVRVEVADSGPGIPAAALPHLFKPFYRAPGDTGRAAAGWDWQWRGGWWRPTAAASGRRTGTRAAPASCSRCPLSEQPASGRRDGR